MKKILIEIFSRYIGVSFLLNGFWFFSKIMIALISSSNRENLKKKYKYTERKKKKKKKNFL